MNRVHVFHRANRRRASIGPPASSVIPRLRRALQAFGGLNSSGVGQREQGTAAVDFFSEVITVYIDHAPEPRERARFI